MTRGNKRLIAYFSRAGSNFVDGGIAKLPIGNTETAAGMIHELAGGDLFRIRTKKEYPADYEATTAEAQEELRADARPELAESVEGMDDYAEIFLGYPNWWGTMPMAVFAFLEAYDFGGATIVPFCTNEGSGLGRSEADIRRLCPGATILKGLSIRGSSVREAGGIIASWLRKSGLIE
jgi:flavodoxin